VYKSNNNKNLEEVLLCRSENKPILFGQCQARGLTKMKRQFTIWLTHWWKCMFHTYTNVINFLVRLSRMGNWNRSLVQLDLCKWTAGLRLRFDLGTNRYFSRMLPHGYLAFGFGDQKWHDSGCTYLFKRIRDFPFRDVPTGLITGNIYDEISFRKFCTGSSKAAYQ